MLYYRLGRHELAATKIEAVLAASPYDGDALTLAGYIALDRGQPERAAAYFVGALAVLPPEKAEQARSGHARAVRATGSPRPAAGSHERAAARGSSAIADAGTAGVPWTAPCVVGARRSGRRARSCGRWSCATSAVATSARRSVTFWSVAQPLLQLATYTFVFATVMKVRVAPAEGGPTCPSCSTSRAGSFPWLALQEAIQRSATSLVDNPTLVKRVIFPVEVLPVELACARRRASADRDGAAARLDGGDGAFRRDPRCWCCRSCCSSSSAFAIGIGWAVAALHVFFRDTAQALGVLMPVWFYLTPILYPQHLVPPFLQPVLALNPLTPLVQAYRDVLAVRRSCRAAPSPVQLAATSLRYRSRSVRSSSRERAASSRIWSDVSCGR